MAAQQFCTQCGIRLQPEARFCSSCGKPVVAAAEAPDTAATAASQPQRTQPSPRPEPQAAHTPAQGSSEASGCGSCLGGFLISLAALAIPVLLLLLTGKSPDGAFMFPGFGVIIFWGLCGSALGNGRLVARRRPVLRSESPGVFWFGLGLYALAGLGLYLLYLLLLFNP